MMSEMYQNFGLPSIRSLTLARDNAYGVPRLHHRSSEGSEPDSPTGGGGSYTAQPGRSDQHVPTDHCRRLLNRRLWISIRHTYPQGLSLNHPGSSWVWIISQRPSGIEIPLHQSSSQDLTRAFDPRRVGQPSGSGDQNRTGLEYSQWRQGQGQARTRPPIYPGDGTTFYEGHTASTSQSAHRSATLPPLPPHTGVFDAQHSDILPMTYAHGSPESRYPDAGDYLRSQLNIGPGEPVNLWSLPEPPSGQKPPQPLPVLIKLAIYGNPRKRLTLQEIYAALEQRFEWFREHKSESAWKVFRNTARPITEPGKGSYWELDISQGEGYKRERKRRKKTASSSQSTAEDDEGSDENDDGSTSPPATQMDLNVDPQLRNEGHSVDGMRLRSNSRRASPYLHHPLRLGSLLSTLDPSIPTRVHCRLQVPMLVSQVQRLAHSRRPNHVSANLPWAVIRSPKFRTSSFEHRLPTPQDTISNPHPPNRPLPYSGFLRWPGCTRRLRQHPRHPCVLARRV
ncbi:forkhead box protein [Salix suchowensis]|nr:forkhead box protein [Salix suchowensis]